MWGQLLDHGFYSYRLASFTPTRPTPYGAWLAARMEPCMGKPCGGVVTSSPVTYQLYNRIHSELDKQKTDDRKGAGGRGVLKMIKFPLEMSFLKVTQRLLSDVF